MADQSQFLAESEFNKESTNSTTSTSEMLVKDSEKYAIFFKMLRMGVPLPAVKNKLTFKLPTKR